jgi:hypothetical protein
MKTMKLFVGLAAAIALSTGCGGNYAEDACDRVASMSKNMADEMSSCMPELEGEGEYTEAEMKACVNSMEACTEDEVDTAVNWLDCYFDTFSCEAIEDEEAAEDALAAMAACDARYDIEDLSAACLNAVNEESNPNVRKALQLKARQ